MSDTSCECKHNDHGHFLLWLVTFCLLMNSCLDCSDERTRQENRVRSLEYRVQQLEGRR